MEPTALECVMLAITTFGGFAGLIAVMYRAENEQEKRRKEIKYGWK